MTTYFKELEENIDNSRKIAGQLRASMDSRAQQTSRRERVNNMMEMMMKRMERAKDEVRC